jgi:nucleotide-binding universal stress UspA family protein
MELATRADIEVVVVHVSDEASIPRFSDQLQHETEAFASEFVSRHCPEGEVRLDLRVGVPGERVVAVCDEEHSDLVALAWSRNLAPGRARVVRHVLEHSRVPVLLVPTHDES